MSMPQTPLQSIFFQNLTSDLAPHLHLPLLLAGDFNSVLDPREDKSTDNRQLTPNRFKLPYTINQFR